MFEKLMLILVALLPAVLLGIYVYKKDRVEKEPRWLLVLLFAAGVLICRPAGYLNGVAEDFYREVLLLPNASLLDGELIVDNDAWMVYRFMFFFFGVALIEETLKWLAMFVIAKLTRHFNCLFDGIVYGVMVALGFAAWENIGYVLEGGWGTALARLFTAVPMHTFCGILMGSFFSWYHIYNQAREMEGHYARIGAIVRRGRAISGKRFLVFSLLLPVLTHGFYDFCCARDSWWMYLGFYAVLIFLYSYCFGKVRKTSRHDRYSYGLAMGLVSTKYPDLREELEPVADTSVTPEET